MSYKKNIKNNKNKIKSVSSATNSRYGIFKKKETSIRSHSSYQDNIRKGVIFLRKDPLLSDIIKQVGPYTIKKKKNKFSALVEAIIFQQLTGKAANSILNNFVKLYGSFPEPRQVLETKEQRLRSAGLSHMKIKYLWDLSQKVETNEINIKNLQRKSDEEVIRQLTQIKGIGVWSAQMFLIFSLGRLDVLPVDDLGLKKGIMSVFGLENMPQRKETERLASKWSPYRTIATWYLWKSLKKFETIG